MLRVRQIRSYAVPRYPAGGFEPWRQPAGVAMFKRSASSAALLLLLESCGETGTTGPPPVRPDFLTENEARAAISQVFTTNGIDLTANAPFEVVTAPGDTTTLALDGYNDSLRIGYEYLADADNDSFTAAVIAKMDSATADAGPYVKITEEIVDADSLARIMQNFIDTLKAHGAI
jgi:hypothetical protein